MNIDTLKIFWWKLELIVSNQLEESLIWKLNSLAINRFAISVDPKERSQALLIIWLPSNQYSEKDRNNIETSLIELAEIFQESISRSKWEKVQDEDWSSSWKKHWGPDPVGNRLLILPSWLKCPAKYSNRTVVHLDPGSAFGTGSHPTTRLCLEALERNPPLNLQVADVGCGSGILGLTALSLGAKEVLAVDIDPLSVSSSLKNAGLNYFSENRFKVLNGSIDTLKNNLNGSLIDLLLCNILFHVIKEIAPGFDRVISPNGQAILSGLLVDQIEDITGFLGQIGWQVDASYQQEKWALLYIKRSPPLAGFVHKKNLSIDR